MTLSNLCETKTLAIVLGPVDLTQALPLDARLRVTDHVTVERSVLTNRKRSILRCVFDDRGVWKPR